MKLFALSLLLLGPGVVSGDGEDAFAHPFETDADRAVTSTPRVAC